MLLSLRHFQKSAQLTVSIYSLLLLLLLLEELPRCVLCFQSLKSGNRITPATSVPIQCVFMCQPWPTHLSWLALFFITIFTLEMTFHLTNAKTEAQESSPVHLLQLKTLQHPFYTQYFFAKYLQDSLLTAPTLLLLPNRGHWVSGWKCILTTTQCGHYKSIPCSFSFSPEVTLDSAHVSVFPHHHIYPKTKI